MDSYENAEQVERVRSLLDGRLANTAFAVFAPDGTTQLTASGRSPQSAFGRTMVEAGLRAIAEKYPGRKLDEAPHTPDFTTVREAINLAACDERPLVLAWGRDAADASRLEAGLRELAWAPEFEGRLLWDITTGDSWRDLVPGAPPGERGVIVVKPEPFGRSATVLSFIDPELELDDQRSMLRVAHVAFDASFEKLPYEEHVQAGLRQGVRWAESIRMEDRDDGPSRR